MSDCHKRHADYCSCLLLPSFFVEIMHCFYYESRVSTRNSALHNNFVGEENLFMFHKSIITTRYEVGRTLCAIMTIKCASYLVFDFALFKNPMDRRYSIFKINETTIYIITESC